MSTVKVANLEGTTSTRQQPTFEGQAKVWVNFDMTGTAHINGDFNVTSLTDDGTGEATFALTNNFAATDTTVPMGSSGFTAANPSDNGMSLLAEAVGSIVMDTHSFGSTQTDFEFNAITAHGDIS